MRVTILNGNQDPANTTFDEYLASLGSLFSARGDEAKELKLRDLDIRSCSGCWSCWVATPGQCVHKDDQASVLKALLWSELAILASPLSMGFVSSLLKKSNERFIPLVLPYITLETGECHHPLRYGRSPDLGVLLQPEPDTDEEDVAIVRAIYEREVLNFHSSLRFCRLTTMPAEEIVHEACRV